MGEKGLKICKLYVTVPLFTSQMIEGQLLVVLRVHNRDSDSIGTLRKPIGPPNCGCASLIGTKDGRSHPRNACLL